MTAAFFSNAMLIYLLFVLKRVVIRGDMQDDAVLCTDSVTFDLKMADTSNIMMLAPDALLPKTEGTLE